MADDQQQAIPTNDQPPTQWGQSLGQDIGNVGSAIESGQQAVTGAVGRAGAAIGNAASDAYSRIKAYIQGDGAMPQDQYQQLRDKIQHGGVTDPNEVTAQAIATGGPPALQATRHNWDAYRGSVSKALGDQNYNLAAGEANKALAYVPDGTSAHVSPMSDTSGVGNPSGFMVSVKDPGGKSQTYQLSPDEFGQVFSGKSGLFDHAAGQGLNDILQGIKQTSAGNNAFANVPPQQAGAPAGQQQLNANGTSGGGQLMAGQNADVNAPGMHTNPRTGEPFVTTNYTDPQGRKHILQMATGPEQTGATPQGAPGQQNYVRPAGNGPAQQSDLNNTQPNIRRANPDFTGNQDFENGPITVTTPRGSHLVGGGARAPSAVPQDVQMLARQIYPNQPQQQALYYSRWMAANAGQQNKIDVAKVQGTQGAQARIQAMQMRLDQLKETGDAKTSSEDLRTASNILGSVMKNGGTLEDALGQMKGHISDQLLGKLTGSPSMQRKLGNSPLPPQALQQLQRGHVTTFGNGQKWTLGPDGSPQQVQ